MKLGIGEPPCIVAEISGNHAGRIENAIRLIREAKAAGADCVKTQCYEPQTITIDCDADDFIIKDGLWKGRTLYELYKSAHTPFAWHKDLYQCAMDEGITIFSSVFDRSSVDLLEGLDCPAYKIASMEIVDLPLIEYAAKTGKPVILSTGMASGDEVLEACQAAGPNVVVLHCTSDYPAKTEDADLSRIQHLGELTGAMVGLSDHTKDYLTAALATALGVVMIEKHLKLDGVTSEDAEFSLSPRQFAQMVEIVKLSHAAMQPAKERPQPSRQLRRSLYAVADIAQGEAFTADNVRSIRPGYGVAPKHLPELIGRNAERAFKRGARIDYLELAAETPYSQVRT